MSFLLRVPKDVIINYIFRYLHGIDALRFMSTCTYTWYIYPTVSDRARIYAPMKNYIIKTVKQRGHYCKNCGILHKKRTRHENRCNQRGITKGMVYCGCINRKLTVLHSHVLECGLRRKRCNMCDNKLSNNESNAIRNLVGCFECGENAYSGCFQCMDISCTKFECTSCGKQHTICYNNNNKYCRELEQRLRQLINSLRRRMGNFLWGRLYRYKGITYATFSGKAVLMAVLDPKCFIILLSEEQQGDIELLQQIFKVKGLKNHPCFIYDPRVSDLNDNTYLLYYTMNNTWRKGPK